MNRKTISVKERNTSSNLKITRKKNKGNHAVKTGYLAEKLLRNGF